MGLSSLFCLDRKITTTREEETPSLPHRSPSHSPASPRSERDRQIPSSRAKESERRKL